MLEGEEMNRNKLIAILLFLLLLLIILCTWYHSDSIAKNRVLTANNPAQVAAQIQPSPAINFNLQKDTNNFELSGNFSKKENIEKLRAALGINELTDLSKVNDQLREQTNVIVLTEHLIPIFYNKYINGSINYSNDKITVEGTVNNSADRDAISTLLANSTVPSTNNTKVIYVPKNPIHFKITKQDEQLTVKGVFHTSTESDELINALGSNNLEQAIELDPMLIPNAKIITITNTLVTPFKENYSEGFIEYNNKTLTIDGIVPSEEAKSKMETALKASGITYVNNTKVIIPGPTPEELAATQLAEEEELKAQAMVEAAQEQAQKEVIELEAEIKKVIDLENINFELNKARLTEKSLNTISHIASILKEHPTVHVEIAGHTDSSGDDAYNLNLSQSRVDSVKKRLIEMGIDSSRLEAIGYGETQALVSNDTEENRHLNRRVEFKIIGE